MKFIAKAGILVSILAIPVFVFLFLKLYGKNHYKIPVYFATDSTLVNGNYQITEAHTIPEFEFINQDNLIFGSDDLKGNIYIADFFFTSCPTICPKMTTQLARVQEAFAKYPEVKIVSFTVDPKADSVSVLKKYALDFRADSSKWNFLTGNKEDIYTLAQKGFFVTAMEDETLPEFIHSEKLILVDKLGWVRGYYDGTDRTDVERLIREVQVLLHIYDYEGK
jgi:protein SCO1/2